MALKKRKREIKKINFESNLPDPSPWPWRGRWGRWSFSGLTRWREAGRSAAGSQPPAAPTESRDFDSLPKVKKSLNTVYQTESEFNYRKF